MSLGPVWDIGMLLGGIGGNGLTTWLVVSYKLGKRDGAHATTLAALQREHREEKRVLEKERAMQSRQNMRIFAAIEQLRRMHRTGNGGIVWEKLDTGGE